MKKKFIISICTFIIAGIGLNVIIEKPLVAYATENNQGVSTKIEQAFDYDKIIIEKGTILTEKDFIYIQDEIDILKNSNNIVTDLKIKELIVNKIEHKLATPQRSKRSYQIFGRHVTSKELLLVARYPAEAVLAFKASKEAATATVNRYGDPTQAIFTDGNADAFRHMVWNAYMTKYIGEDLAEKFANAHEENTSTIDAQMDLENNRLGRIVYLMYKPDDIPAKVGEYIDNGWAFRLDQSKQHIIETDNTGKQ